LAEGPRTFLSFSSTFFFVDLMLFLNIPFAKSTFSHVLSLFVPLPGHERRPPNAPYDRPPFPPPRCLLAFPSPGHTMEPPPIPPFPSIFLTSMILSREVLPHLFRDVLTFCGPLRCSGSLWWRHPLRTRLIPFGHSYFTLNHPPEPSLLRSAVLRGCGASSVVS